MYRLQNHRLREGGRDYTTNEYNSTCREDLALSMMRANS